MNAQLQTQTEARAAPSAAPAPSGLLQRKCAFSDHSLAGREHEARRDRDQSQLQRAAVSSAPIESVPSIVGEVLRSPGQPLGTRTRAFFESRFGHDFSRVRVHTDARAAASAHSVNALAYTVGRNLVFGLDEYRPGTRRGQRLLAHELAHVVQQAPGNGAESNHRRLRIEGEETPSERAAEQSVAQIFSSPSPAFPNLRKEVVVPLQDIRAPVLQRAVSPEMPTIRDRLSTGIFNSVTEEEAHEVLVMLKRLRQTSEVDFRDTIAAMESEGLVERLLGSVGQADRLGERETLRQIANARVFTRERRAGSTTVTTTVTGSCTPERYQQIHTAATQAISWLGRAITRTGAFLNAPTAAASTGTRDALDLHFMSTATNVARHVHARLEHIRRDIRSIDPFTLECHGTWDTDCLGNVAYIPGGRPEELVACPAFFRNRPHQQVATIIHEMAHTQVGGAHITDHAYTGERVMSYLSTAEALTNAESYERYVEHLATSRTPSTWSPSDTREDCPDDWWTILRRTLAYAQRMNRNAENVTDSLTPQGLQSWPATRRQLLGGNTQSDIDRAKEVFRRAKTRLSSAVDFECEPRGGGRCTRFETYWYALGDFHVCPSWRALGSDESWTISLLSGLYGYFDLEDDNTRRRNYARLAYDVTQQSWPVPTLAEVLGSPAWRNSSIRIFVAPTLEGIPRSNYTESGSIHERLSSDIPVYQGPNFQHRPMPFTCKVLFAVDTAAAPRPTPFTPPVVSVLFEFNAPRGGFRRNERDPRPDYLGANQALRTTFPHSFDFTLARDGALHMRFELTDPDSGINRVYDDTIAVDVERIRDIIPPGSTRLA